MLTWYDPGPEWDRICGAAPFEMSGAYGAAAEAQGARVWRLGLGDPGDPDGLAQIVCRGVGPVRLGLLPRGVLWRRPPGAEAAARLQRELPGFVWLLHAGHEGRIVAPGRTVARLDLAGDPRARMAKSWRNALTRAGRQGLCVFVETGCPDWLIRAEAAIRRARGVRGLPGGWVRSLARAAPGCLETLVAYRDGAPLGAMCFARHGAGATYLLGWNGAQGRRLGAHQLLLDRAMARLRDRGADALDLGLIDPERCPGLTRFKLGAGGRPVDIPATRLLAPLWRPRRSPTRLARIRAG